MNEIRPSLTYDHACEQLTLRPDLVSGSVSAANRRQVMDHYFASLPGVTVDDDTIAVHVPETFAGELEFGLRAPKMERALAAAGRLFDLYYPGCDDPVVHPGVIRPDHLRAHVFPQFQRWLSAMPRLEEPLAADVFESMAAPYGLQDIERARNMTLGERHASTDHPGFALDMHYRTFWLHATDANGRTKRGIVPWPAPALQTRGQAALEAPDIAKDVLDMSPHRRRHDLYVLDAQDCVFPQQTLSLLLGLGALARHASRHEGAEDILRDANWAPAIC